LERSVNPILIPCITVVKKRIIVGKIPNPSITIRPRRLSPIRFRGSFNDDVVALAFQVNANGPRQEPAPRTADASRTSSRDRGRKARAVRQGEIAAATPVRVDRRYPA
jgi:hypothetical protein